MKLLTGVIGWVAFRILKRSTRARKTCLDVMKDVLDRHDAEVSRAHTKYAKVSKSSDDGGLIECTDDNLRTKRGRSPQVRKRGGESNIGSTPNTRARLGYRLLIS